MFDAIKAKDSIIAWIRDWFRRNGEGCVAVVGISGGKDSTIVAALCAEALGKNRVVGLMMPASYNTQDEQLSKRICDYIGIRNYTIDVGFPAEVIENRVKNELGVLHITTKINLPARLRMTTLYAVSQTLNGRVVNTCNLSEDYVGYATRYGDGAGDFSPLSQYTVAEVRQIGKALGLPDEFVYKVPTDGLCGMTDEENLGFTYEVLDRYIRTGDCEDTETKARIDALHEKNKFKLELMESCPYHEESTRKIYTHDEASRILDMFEEVLSEYNISVPSPEDDERDPDNMVGLYGSTYSDLLDNVEWRLEAILSVAQEGAEVIPDVYSGTY